MLVQTLNWLVAMEDLCYHFKKGAFKPALGAEVTSPNTLNTAFCYVSVHCLFTNTLVLLPKILRLRFLGENHRLETVDCISFKVLSWHVIKT